MKLGVFLVLLADRSIGEALDYAKELGVDCVEIATGAYVGNGHANPAVLLADKAAREALSDAVRSRGLEISALSCHGNPVHPKLATAKEHDQAFRDTVDLASEMGVKTVVTFSGQPGDRDGGSSPNWVTQIWPPDFMELLDWQWKEKVGPYWADAAEFARQRGVRVAIELHPGFIAYNTASFIRLRNEAGRAGENLFVNFDPSHLFWQQMDPIECVDALGEAIAHVHAKDTALHTRNVQLNGVLDTIPYGDVAHRSWIFRTVGYGHGGEFWKTLVSHLRLSGYDGVISIEHEDGLMSVDEGLRKAYAALRGAIITEPPPQMWWA
jgi:sugar phosphate isomerase/epimerase